MSPKRTPDFYSKLRTQEKNYAGQYNMSFSYKNNILHAEDIALPALAQKVQTPCYVYSSERIQHNYQILSRTCQEHLPGPAPLIAYACKANASLAVLTTLARLGCGADIVSGGEMKRALAAGIPSEKIVFSGVGKSESEIEMALFHQIAQINIESAAEMDMIAETARRHKQFVPVSFRLNPDVDAKTHDHTNTGKKESKFGISAELIEKLYQKALSDPYLEPKGISMHIGSQLTTLEPFASAFEVLAEFVTRLKDKGLDIETLDIGGGVGLPYSDESLFALPDYISLIRKTISPLKARLILEPGRSLTGDSGILLSRVLYSKKAGAKNYLIVDAGMTDFMRPSLYDALHPVYPVETDNSQTSKKTGENMIFDVVGPVCETADVLAKNVSLPSESTRPGALIAFMMTGAYGAVMASTYNARPLPAEVMVHRDKAEEIRPQLTVDDLLRLEKIPSWLENQAVMR